MNQTFSILLSIFFIACGPSTADKNKLESETKIDSLKSNLQTTLVNTDSLDENYETYYVVVADTSQNYWILHKKMFDLHRKLKIPIDTMDRYYNKEKNLIAIPNNELHPFAGDYFPRRFPSVNLSLEYLNFYQNQAGAKTIALVIGIYESEKSADSIFNVILKKEVKVFKIKTDMFVGCIL